MVCPRCGMQHEGGVTAARAEHLDSVTSSSTCQKCIGEIWESENADTPQTTGGTAAASRKKKGGAH